PNPLPQGEGEMHLTPPPSPTGTGIKAPQHTHPHTTLPIWKLAVGGEIPPTPTAEQEANNNTNPEAYKKITHPNKQKNCTYLWWAFN
ncbi:hypothetical protein ACVGWD_03570, partial [Enterobacter asburiae]